MENIFYILNLEFVCRFYKHLKSRGRSVISRDQNVKKEFTGKAPGLFLRGHRRAEPLASGPGPRWRLAGRG